MIKTLFALGMVAMGAPLPAMAVPLVITTTVVSSIVFILVALWRFQHVEL